MERERKRKREIFRGRWRKGTVEDQNKGVEKREDR